MRNGIVCGAAFRNGSRSSQLPLRACRVYLANDDAHLDRPQRQALVWIRAPLSTASTRGHGVVRSLAAGSAPEPVASSFLAWAELGGGTLKLKARGGTDPGAGRERLRVYGMPKAALKREPAGALVRPPGARGQHLGIAAPANGVGEMSARSECASCSRALGIESSARRLDANLEYSGPSPVAQWGTELEEYLARLDRKRRARDLLNAITVKHLVHARFPATRDVSALLTSARDRPRGGFGFPAAPRRRRVLDRHPGEQAGRRVEVLGTDINSRPGARTTRLLRSWPVRELPDVDRISARRAQIQHRQALQGGRASSGQTCRLASSQGLGLCCRNVFIK